MMKNNKGFTLMELMIVVAIIGIIAMFAIPSYQNAQRKARITEAVAQLTALQSEIEKTRLTQRASYACMKLTGQTDPSDCSTVVTIPNNGNIYYNNQLIYKVTYTPNANKYTLTANAQNTWIPTNDQCRRLDLDGQGNLAQKNYCQK